MSYIKSFASVASAPIPAPSTKLKLEGVTVCVNYADILAHTLPLNKTHFDRLIVVTAPEDEATQRVCEYWGVECILTDAFRSRWKGEFCKGSGINAGLDALDKDAWILHFDADVVLPPNFRQVLQRADLDPAMIYGCDRAEFKSFSDWEKFYRAPEPHTQGMGFILHIEHHGQRFGARVAFPHEGGFIPIGFFQLWHAESGVLRYPAGHTDAGREDSHFAAQWPRRKRGFLPEIVVYHLESEAAPMGANWQGRKTKPFGL